MRDANSQGYIRDGKGEVDIKKGRKEMEQTIRLKTYVDMTEISILFSKSVRCMDHDCLYSWKSINIHCLRYINRHQNIQNDKA